MGITEMSQFNIYKVNDGDSDEEMQQTQNIQIAQNMTNHDPFDSFSSNLDNDGWNKAFPVYTPFGSKGSDKKDIINDVLLEKQQMLGPVLNTGFSTSTIDEELYESQSAKSGDDKFKKYTKGKTTLGDDDGAE